MTLFPPPPHLRAVFPGTGVLPSLVAAAFKSGKSLGNKVAVDRTNEYVATWGYRAVSLACFTAVLAVTGGFFVPSSTTFWAALGVNTVLFATASVLISRAYKHGDVSIVAPLLALTPLAVALPAWLLLREAPSPVGLVGILLVTAGAYALNVGDAAGGDVVEPLRALARDRGAQYAGLALVVVAVIPSVDKIGLRHSSTFLWVFAVHAGTVVALAPVTARFDPSWRRHARDESGLFVLLGVANAGLWAAQITAYTVADVATVQAIKRASILLTVAVGHVALDERRVAERLGGGALILAGVVLVGYAAV